MTKIDFTAILDKQIDSIPEPKPVPPGMYKGTIASVPLMREQETKEGTKGILSIPVRLTEALDDVDPDDLAAAGGLKGKMTTFDFWISPPEAEDHDATMFKLASFLKSMGLTGNFQENLPNLVGQDVTVMIDHRTYTAQDGELRTQAKCKRLYAAG